MTCLGHYLPGVEEAAQLHPSYRYKKRLCFVHIVPVSSPVIGTYIVFIKNHNKSI